jgi:hypothetical protein
LTTKWLKITEEQGHAIRGALPNLKTFSSCTDHYGQYGEPSIMDEWGLHGADYPILKAYSRYQRREDFKEGQDYPERLDTTYYIAINSEEDNS